MSGKAITDTDLIKMAKYVVRSVNLSGAQAAMREDCEQEAYLEGLRGIRGAEAKGQRPAFRHIRARMKKAVFRVILGDGDSTPIDESKLIDGRKPTSEANEFAVVALAILTSKERSMLMAYLSDGVREAAVAEGITAKGVYYRVQRALSKIRASQGIV